MAGDGRGPERDAPRTLPTSWAGYDRVCLHVGSLPPYHVLETPPGDVESLMQRYIGVLVATVQSRALMRRRFELSRAPSVGDSRSRSHCAMTARSEHGAACHVSDVGEEFPVTLGTRRFPDRTSRATPRANGSPVRGLARRRYFGE